MKWWENGVEALIPTTFLTGRGVPSPRLYAILHFLSHTKIIRGQLNFEQLAFLHNRIIITTDSEEMKNLSATKWALKYLRHNPGSIWRFSAPVQGNYTFTIYSKKARWRYFLQFPTSSECPLCKKSLKRGRGNSSTWHFPRAVSRILYVPGIFQCHKK